MEGNALMVESIIEQNIEEIQTKSDSDKKYLIEQHCKNSKALSEGNSSKQKNPKTQRIKLREHNIIVNNKANARPPFYYKFDRSTTLILQLLIDNKLSGDFHNVVGKGSNSIVIHAHCYGRYHMYFPNGNAIKLYKLRSAEKNNAIYKKVQRENEHLQILRDQHFSNNAPHPVYINKNVIVTSFIGSDQETASTISDLQAETLNITYTDIVTELNTWYKKLGLIHGNLSAKNILFYMDKMYIIGWSHSVKKSHPMALKKLMKDCHFITTFFQSKNVPVQNVEELFKDITGLKKISNSISEVLNNNLWKDPHQTNPNRTETPSSISTRDRFKTL